MAGKFSAKNRENAVDVRTILAEREQAQKRRSNTALTTPKRKPVQPAAATMPTLKKSAKPIQKPRRGPRLSGVIFYTIFFLCIFLFYTATYFGLLELRDWLNRYEMAQPTTKSQEIFETLFYDPDWDSLYDIVNAQNAAYGSKDDFISYMENRVGETDLTYIETSTGLSNDKKYIVRLGNEKIATFTLVNHSQSASQTEIADWQLGSLEFFVQYNESYFIKELQSGFFCSSHKIPPFCRHRSYPGRHIPRKRKQGVINSDRGNASFAETFPQSRLSIHFICRIQQKHGKPRTGHAWR